MNPIHNYKISTVFPSAAIFVGYLILTIGFTVFILTWNILAIPLFGVVGLFLSFSYYGIDFNIETDEYKEYASYFGIKTGEWKDIKELPDITIFKSRESTRTYSRTMSTEAIDNNFKIYLLSGNHRRKVLVKKCKTEEEAKENIEYLVDLIGLNYTKFQPPVFNRRNR